MKLFGRELKFNNNKVYHAGDKPTPSEIGAASASHTHNYAGSSSAGGNANAAVKLATARTINGTSFDGSGNITTSQWGTARNISVADSDATNTGSAVSVNGSANVTLKLPATIKASLNGNASTATKAAQLTTTRKIGRADFNGTANIELGAIAGRATISSSADTNANKFSKFARIDVSGGTYRSCSGTLEFIPTEGSSFTGELYYYFRTGSAITSTSIVLDWKTISNTSYSASVVAVKVSDGVFDLYYKPVGTWDTMSITNVNSTGTSYMTLYSSQGYVASVTAAATSRLNNIASTVTGNAGTATTLQNTRTINGTNFNGSANITTATWGTARTLTIGNSGKSVNGSANVSWSLSEIGAAPASHNHGLLHDSLGVTVSNTTTDSGWSMINSNYNGYILKTIRSNASAPAWLQNNYSAGIAFGGGDTKGVMSVAYNSPSVRFAGGNGTKPVWYFTLTGTSAKSYNMDSLAANTANTLATARTINGTSFNGSGNITTANWGTARTLTIGNTGKSVNGSGNVSWSLSEIGAFSSGGGDVGGNIHLTPDNAGITGVCGGGTDRWSIKGGGADDNGYLEINTKDNGNEPIYVRQYDANGLVRTAALLDGNGATSFPSKISVPIFHILNSPGSQNNAIFGGSGDAADWNTHNVVFKSHWGIGFRDYQDVCRIVFDTRSGNINTRGLLYSEGGISCTAWGHFNGSISADGGATIGSHTYINAMSVGDKITGETKFSKDGAWYDPWNGVGCAIKTHGNIAVTGIVRATDRMEINGTPISIQSSAPGCGGVWIQI